MIRAIPIDYAGVWFRPTLEADWAFNLDALGITWSYEPWAVDLGGVYYLADFYLPGQNVWLEVKGPHSARLHKARRFAEALNPDRVWDHRKPLVVVGRAAERERLSFHGALPGSEMILNDCSRCRHTTFIDYNGPWVCRVCGQYGKPNSAYESGSLPFHRAPRTGRAA